MENPFLAGKGMFPLMMGLDLSTQSDRSAVFVSRSRHGKTAILEDMVRITREFKPAPPPIRFVENVHMTVTAEDWSEVRSPGRARRRRRMGHRQRIRYYQAPSPDIIHHKESGMMVGHPVTIAKVLKAINDDMGLRAARLREEMTMGALYGAPFPRMRP